MRFVKILGWLTLVIVLLACSVSSPLQEQRNSAKLKDVKTWLYSFGDLSEYSTITRLANSDYDMLVLDYLPSVSGDEEYPMADVINTFHENGKLVLAYLAIGDAEAYRTYWQQGWEVGNPKWIIAPDPGGWEDNYVVSYWDPGWQSLWLGKGLFIKRG